MFLHIGNGETVLYRDIIGIFDMDTATVSSVTRETLKKYEKEKKLRYGDTDIPRTFLLCGEREKGTVMRLSHISSQGLTQRAGSPFAGIEEGTSR